MDTAKKIVKEATNAALDQESFLQNSKISSRADLANFEITRMTCDLAKKDQSAVLAQLASRVASTVRFGGANQTDVVAKVKGLIRDMISKDESEAEANAAEKAFCVKELAETNLRKDDKIAEIEKLGAKIDKQESQSAQLKNQVAALQAELAEFTRTQAEMDKVRAEEKAVFEKSSAETDGLEGAQRVLQQGRQGS